MCFVNWNTATWKCSELINLFIRYSENEKAIEIENSSIVARGPEEKKVLTTKNKYEIVFVDIIDLCHDFGCRYTTLYCSNSKKCTTHI